MIHLKRFYNIVCAALCLLLTRNATAQTTLFIVGDCVPNGVQELTVFPNSQLKYAGALKEGYVRIRNTREHKITTQYLKPVCEDACIVNHGIAYTMVRDSTESKWEVPFSEDHFRFTVDTSRKTLNGELFRPWNELFIVGGAVECGWESYTFLPFTRIENEICTYEWTGIIKERPEHGEPKRFKFSGQNAWEPKMLHPYSQDANILVTKQILTNGTGDNKWSVTQDGRYHIVVDVFRETVWAEYLNNAPHSTPEEDTEENAADHSITIRRQGNILAVGCPSTAEVQVCDANGLPLYRGTNKNHNIQLIQHGMYVVTAKMEGRTVSQKIAW